MEVLDDKRNELLELSGGALSQLSTHRFDAAERISNRRQRSGFGNLLIHGYAEIDRLEGRE